MNETDEPSMAVLGARGPVGAVVARYAQSIGWRVVAFGPADPPDEEDAPWVRGAEWRRAADLSPGDLEGADVVVDARVAGADPTRPLESVLAEAAVSRVVRTADPRPDGAGAEPGRTPGGAELSLLDVAEVGPAGTEVVEAAEVSDGTPLPPEQLGVALLRVAVEPEWRPRLSPQEVADLGRSMTIQSG